MSSTDTFCREVEAARNRGADTCERRHPAGRHRVLRGGSWNNNERTNLLSSNRNHNIPGNRNNNNGFRLVLVVSGGKARQPAGRESDQCQRSARTLAGRNLFQSRAKNEPNPDAFSLGKMDLPEDNAGSHQGQDAAATVVTGARAAER